jgi:predicted peroxiredoxin
MKRIKANSKKQFEELKKEYRNKGYNFITFCTKLVEMENMSGDMVVIER